jgi:sugar phosphate isomerase/epimerase
MDLGLSLNCFHGWTLAAALRALERLAERFGVTALEVNLGVGPGAAPGLPEAAVADLASRFPVRGVHLPFLGLSPVSSDPLFRGESLHRIHEALRLAGRLGSAYVVAHAPGSDLAVPWEEERPRWVKMFDDLARRCREAGMSLAVENAERLNHLDRLLEVVEPLAPRGVQLCIDVGHAHDRRSGGRLSASRAFSRLDGRWKGSFRIPAGMPYERWRSLASFLGEKEPLVHHFHLHDRRGRKDHLPLGEGTIDVRTIARFLAARPVILEIPSKTEADLEGEIRKARDLLATA